MKPLKDIQRCIYLICLILVTRIKLAVAVSDITDNSIIYTAREDGLRYFNQTDTTNWLFNQNLANLLLRKVPIRSTRSVVGMSYDYSSGQLVVSDSGFNFITLISLNDKVGTPLHIGTSPGVGQMTIDWRARNVYWTDSGYGWIAMKSFPDHINTVDSFDRSFRVIVDTFLDVPTGIIASPTKYFLFWADAGDEPKIERSNLVGDGRTVLVWQGLVSPTCLTIDGPTDRLFWSDPVRSTIEYISFDGTDRSIFVSENGYDYYGIAVFQDRLIYTAPGRNISGVYSLMNAFSGTKLHVSVPLYYVDVYDQESQPRSPQEPCDLADVDCDQICVHLGNSQNSTCYCEDGYNLVGENQCKANTTVLERHILFTLQTDICATSINVIYSPQNVKPRTDCTVVQHSADITRFAIDMNNDYIFFSDGERLYKQVAFSSQKTQLYESDRGILDIDYDWKTEELFWSERGYDTVLFKTTTDPTVAPSPSPNTPGTITSIAVDPHNNHVYWIAQESSSFKLYLWNRGDNSVRNIITSALSNPTDIEYDRRNNRLLWNDDRYYGIIRPDGTGVQNVNTLPDTATRHGIAVYKKLVFCTLDDGISHFDVYSNGSTDVIVVNADSVALNQTIYDVHVFDSTTQQHDLDVCEVDNNGCEHLCLPSDVPQCACYLGYELGADGKSCSTSVLSQNFSLVLDGLYGRVFQFQTNARPVNLRIINIGQLNHPVSMAFDDYRDTLTWVDGQSKSIRRTHIRNGEETTLTGSDFLETSVIATDVLTGNVYITKDRTIYVINTDGQRTFLADNVIQGTVKSIAISLTERKIVWIEIGNEPRIMRADMNGTSVQTIIAFDPNRIAAPQVVKFDPEDGQFIYWCDSAKDKIERVDGNLATTAIYERQEHNPVALDVVGNYLYYIPEDRRRIFVIDKRTGQEVSIVMETPLLGAIHSIHVSRSISIPTTVTTTPSPSSKSSLPIVPIAAGAGGGLLLIVIIVLVVFCVRRKNGGKGSRPQSTLPSVTSTSMQNRLHRDYDDFGSPSPDPPPRPLTDDEKKDGGIYHDLDETALVVDLPAKDSTKQSTEGHESTRYSKFPEQDYNTSKYLSPVYRDNTPKPDYDGHYDNDGAAYFDLNDSTRERLGMVDNTYLLSSAQSEYSDDGYLLSSSIQSSRVEYSRHPREARNLSDRNTGYTSHIGTPHAHMGGWHGSRSGGEYNTGFIS